VAARYWGVRLDEIIHRIHMRVLEHIRLRSEAAPDRPSWTASDRARTPTERRPREDVVRYYEVAGPDYAAWSPKFNMHFGYFDGENESAAARAHARSHESGRARSHSARRGSAGRGRGHGLRVGATGRFIAEHQKNARVFGFTIVPWQVASGEPDQREEAGLRARVRLALADYARTPLADASVERRVRDREHELRRGAGQGRPRRRDGAHREARRPASTSATGSGRDRGLGPLSGRIYRTVCRSWAIEEMAAIGPFVRALERNGFGDVRVEEVSWRVAPSFAHVPFLCLRFALGCFLRGEFRWTQERRQNLIGSFFGCLLGLCRSRIGYYLVGATRRGD
jgi:hypothetical protein